MGNLISDELILLFIIFCLIIIPVILFLLTLQNTLKAIDAGKRRMRPGYVWLLLIPFFNLYWIFIVVGAISNSCKVQLEKYGDSSIVRSINNLGLGFAIFSVCDLIPFISIVLSLPTLLFFILFWIKVNEARKRIVMLKRTFLNSDENSIFR